MNNKILCLFLVLVFSLCSITVYAETENVLPEVDTTETVETIEETQEIENSSETEIVEDTTEKSQLELLLGKIDFLISLIYCWFLWSFFCAIYKVLYRLFCFVI